MGNELVPTNEVAGMAVAPTAKEFDAQLSEASAKARSLKAVISENSWSVKIGGSEHIRVEAWITLASGYNCTARVVSSRRLEGYDVAFEARAEVIRNTPDGPVVVGSAEAECGTEGDGIWTGNQPAFAVRSMAQTRAISKAISSVFRWVVVLAGYSGTPFEDMPVEQRGGSKPSSGLGRSPLSNPMSGGATDNQVKFLLSLGYEGDVGSLSKADASKEIERLKNSQNAVQSPASELKAKVETPEVLESEDGPVQLEGPW
jgi:hypothetical protein